MTLEIPQCSLVPSTFKSSLQYTLLQWSGITRGIYRIDGKFGGELNLAVWRSSFATTKLKSTNISYLHIYIWRSLTKLPNLNPPIFLHWQFGTQPPNFNSHRYFRLYGMLSVMHATCLSMSDTSIIHFLIILLLVSTSK